MFVKSFSKGNFSFCKLSSLSFSSSNSFLKATLFWMCSSALSLSPVNSSKILFNSIFLVSIFAFIFSISESFSFILFFVSLILLFKATMPFLAFSTVFKLSWMFLSTKIIAEFLRSRTPFNSSTCFLTSSCSNSPFSLTNFDISSNSFCFSSSSFRRLDNFLVSSAFFFSNSKIFSCTIFKDFLTSKYFTVSI